MKFNKYQCPLSCTDCGKVNVFNVLESVKPPYFHQISLCFFKCFCKTICSTEKILDMRGSLVYEKLGRHLQDIDIPILLIFLKENQDIIHLNLASNNISDTGFINLLDHLLLYKNIQELDVQNNNIANYGIDYMLECAKKLELRNLNLRANKFVDQNTKNVALFLLENKHMCSLNIADVNQTASDLIYFMMVLSSDQEVSNETLKSLDISGPNPGCMYYFDSAHFADVIGHMLKYNTTLRALHLQKYNFSCHNIEIMMSNAKYNDSLHLLDLGCNNIGDHGIDHISAWLTKRPVLKTLILCKNIITDHGARSLSYAIPFSKLLFLDISHNKITDDGIVNILYTLKKTPLLRQLRVFGNCIGHQAAKIVKRMLISQVLDQKNIDVRPYKVDLWWHFARYEEDYCKKDYHDVPYHLSSQPPRTIPPTRRSIRKYYKYTYSIATEFKLQHSAVTFTSTTLGTDHARDCKCCYCFKCEVPYYDKQCRGADHPDTCTCCKCKGDESSDWSINKSVLNKIVSPFDPMKNIEHILKQVNSMTKEDIIRWFNINNDILEENFKLIDPNGRKSTKNATLCKCSWMQLSTSVLQKYLQKSSSKDLVIIPRDDFIYLNTTCKNVCTKTSSLVYCSNI
ncbi:uncharacterized protein LOC132914661 [Bombus pascuorum]|uniref:uncharacterized protein LOC132914661 n=1 Tax=Bombus pascuorum TaxID=65598 RepID=UPI00298DE72B|nr:uncharacterized protein LOC132914661 [Bombus pascuorum]